MALPALIAPPPAAFHGFPRARKELCRGSGGPAAPVIFINASRPFEMVLRLIRAALMRYSVCLLLAKAAQIKYKTVDRA